VRQLGPFALAYFAHLVRDNADVLNIADGAQRAAVFGGERLV